MSEPSPRAQIGRTPIPGGSSAGENCSAEESYEAAVAEATKDAGIQGPIDWEKVVQIGTEIVRDRSKDFKMASYLVVGLTHLDHYIGLCDGLEILVGMVEEHWETGFPAVKRLRGRANAFSWMAEKSARVLERVEVQGSDTEAIERAYQSINDLGKLLDERLGDHDVQLGDLMRSLREARDRARALAPPPPPEPTPEPVASAEGAPGAEAGAGAGTDATAPPPAAAAAPPVAAPPPAAPAAAAAAVPAGEITSKADANQLIQKAATFYKDAEAASPISYRLTRIVRWSDIAADPPGDAEGVTQLIDPAPERIAGLRGLYEAGNWETLFPAAEEAFRERPLWLDAQRYSIEAARGLGGGHTKVADALLDELRSLLRRAPGMPRLAFRGGAPFADSDTRAWIESEVLAADEGASGPGAAAGSAVDASDLDRARQESRQLAKKKRLGEGIAMLQDVMQADPSPRGRFLGRLEIALLCADTGQDRMALPVLEELDAELVRHGLDHWEPGLAVQVLRSLYRCRRRMAEKKGAPPELAARADEAFQRLCQVDPQAAATLD